MLTKSWTLRRKRPPNTPTMPICIRRQHNSISFISIFTALALPHYLPLLGSQSYPTRRAVASEILRSLLRNKILVSTTENLDRVLQAVRVLIKEGMQQSTGYP